MLQGAVRPRPVVNRSQAQPGLQALQPRSQAHPGVQPLSPFTHTQLFQPLPQPLGAPPYHYDLATAIPDIANLAEQNKKIVFHTVGDTGPIKQPERQKAVADTMIADLAQGTDQRPSFFYHLGDVVYYNGEYDQYYSQFYEPYDHYDAPILSIPGNHDGDPVNSSQTSLDGWVAYFMTPTPHIDPASHDAPRVTVSQPNVYFTLAGPFVTIVGMYTNVPEGGSIDSVQQQWLTNELATAPQDRALIVALHHPIYSFDSFHSGAPRMADALQHAINDSRRVPNMVLTAHVHLYQRIEKEIVPGAVTPFLVAGHGGYYHLHQLTAGDGAKDPDTGAHLIKGDDQHFGYVTLAVDAEKITGNMTTVGNAPADANHGADNFEYPATAQFLPEGTVASL